MLQSADLFMHAEPSRTSPREKPLVEQAVERLRNSPYLPLREVSCEYRRGVLSLRGEVATFYLKQLAQTTVSDLDGIDEIQNEIEVTRMENGRGRHPPTR
jgi:osmotically-inducible protein OsmY